MDFIWDNLFKGRQENTSLTDSLKANMLFQDFNFFELKLLENIVRECLQFKRICCNMLLAYLRYTR